MQIAHSVRDGDRRVNQMTEYRACSIGADGHFVGFEPLICANDAEAIDKAKRLIGVHGIELWQADRLVTKLEPQQK